MLAFLTAFFRRLLGIVIIIVIIIIILSSFDHRGLLTSTEINLRWNSR